MEEKIPPSDSLSLRLAAANGLIRRRRSIKPADMDPERPVDPKLVASILENANWAPTHGMTEPWRFFVFSDEARETLADWLQELYQKLTPADQFRQDKYDKMGNNPMLAPIVIAIGMKRQEIEKIPEIEEVAAVACAVQNMHLTASAIGLAGFWSSPPILYTDEAREWLGMESEKDKCLGLFYLGWPKSEDWPMGKRGPIEEKVIWERE